MSYLNVVNANDIIELQTKFNDLNDQLNNLQKDHKVLLDKYLEKERETEGLMVSIESLSKKSSLLDEITLKNDELSQQILEMKKIEKDYLALTENNKEMENQNNILQKNINMITKQLDYLDQERNLFKEANNELSNRYEEIAKKIDQLEKEKNKLIDQLGGSQIEKQNLIDLKQELQQLRNDKHRIVIENDQLNTRVSLLNQKVQEKDSILQQNSHQLSALETVLQEIKTQNLSLQNTKEKEIAYRADNLQLLNQVSDLEKEKSLLEKHNLELLQRGGVLETENERLMDENLALQNIIQKLDK